MLCRGVTYPKSTEDRSRQQTRAPSTLATMLPHRTGHVDFLSATWLILGLSFTCHVSASTYRSLGQIVVPGAPSDEPPENADWASPALQRREGNALLELRKALNNHPVFDGFTEEQQKNNSKLTGLPRAAWNMKDNLYGMPGYMRTPCSYAQWAWIGCSKERRVISINIEGPELSKVNRDWAVQGSNPLKGSIPWDKLTVLDQLTDFNIAHHIISGSLNGIGALKGLMNFSISENKFTGAIPDEVSQLKALVEFRVDINQFSGVLPQSMSTLENLAALSVSSNSLGGPWPEWIGNLASLQWLDLSSTAYSGNLPESWSKLTKLTGMQLQFTNINGSVPSAWSGMKSLGSVSFVATNLQSTIPDFIMRLPRIKNVRLQKNKLYGPLPLNFIGLFMHEVNLEENYLNGTAGPIPANASDQLDLSLDTNCFSGTTPDINAIGYQPRARDVCIAFYTALYTAPGATEAAAAAAVADATTKSNRTIIIVVVVVVIFVLATLGLLGYFYWTSNRRTNISKLFTKGLRQTSREFTISELKKATENWHTEIGKGGYGTVFKAELTDGSFVAVKRLDQVSKQGDVEFIREVELLSRVHHRHLVNLIGFCAERGERALVYEYMAMGSLYEHLHGESAKQYPLSWDSRCKIAIHVALGIEYLHYGADPPLIHRDIKSANILLSDDGYSKVADFGLCKEAPVGAAADGSEQLVPTATAVRGSFGYLDPEYVNTSILSEKSDVYSYGVVLLELISGHKSIHDWQPLAYWAEEYLADREKTPLMVDPALEGNFDLDELYALCDIARTCVQDQSANRPTIRDVAKALVENLGHGTSSFMGSQQDSASIVPSSQSDASSMPSTTYTPSTAGSGEESKEFLYQNYSETLHWTPSASGEMNSKNGGGLTISTGTKGDRLPVPVPKRPSEHPPKEGKEDK